MDTFEKVYERLPQGWLSEPEARLLWSCAEKAGGPILEVGCYRGRSAVLLASFGRDLYAVDPFADFDSDDPSGNNIHAAFVENVVSHFSNVQLFRVKIEDWPTRPVGFAYLDGDHTAEGTRRQIEVALACGAKTIAIHDVNDSGDGLAIKRVALEMLGPWHERAERLAVWLR